MDMIKLLLANPVVLGIILAVVMGILGIIVKATKTKKDDEIFAMICHAFNLAEKIIPDKNRGAPWMAKTDEALKVFNAQYKKRMGDYPTPKIEKHALDQWSVMATKEKGAIGSNR